MAKLTNNILPKPNTGENRETFVSRCMGNNQAVMDFPDDGQRFAVCTTQFESSQTTNMTVSGMGLRLNAASAIEGMTQNRLRHLMSNLIRPDTLDNIEYLVCPTILLVEGIMNNLFYGAQECAKFPESWNGRPVVVDHPELLGKPISANSPAIVERQTVGQIFNVLWDDVAKKLKGEVWINIAKCEKVAPVILQMLRDNMCLEVSTGLFTECDGKAGVWNSKQFLGTVSNFRPDHLALLPNDKGACSWEDGGGLPRVNKDKNKNTESGRKGAMAMFRALGQKFGFFPTNDEHSHTDIFFALDQLLGATLEIPADDFAFIDDVFDDTFVYVWVSHADGTRRLFQQGYRLLEGEEVEFVGDPVEVRERREFVPVTNEDGSETGGPGDDRGTATNKDKDKEVRMNRKEKITALIANSSDWVEGDREGLVTMNDSQFDKIVRMNETVVVNAKEKAEADKKDETPKANKDEGKDKKETPVPKANKDDDPPVETPKPQSTDDVIANIEDPAIRSALSGMIKREKEVKANMITELTANKSCPFTKDQLASKDVEELQGLLQLSGSTKPTADYSAQAPAVNVDLEANQDETPPMPELYPKKDTAAA